MPNTYQRTTSVLAMGRFAAVHFASPVSLALRFGKSPAGQRGAHAAELVGRKGIEGMGVGSC